MALPANGTAWPPIDPAVRTALADWSAWYSADPDKLAWQYANRGVRQPLTRAGQLRGGMVGRLSRWWWGQPTPVGERRTKIHVPLASDISRASADLLFSEPPKITVEDNRTQDRINDLIANGLHATLLESAELGSALGGSYLRVVWDKEIRPKGPWISTVAGNAGIPEFRYGVLCAVTFWTVILSDGNRVVRHLERHEPGRILHGVYDGTTENLGRAVPLAEFEATAPFAGLVDSEGGIASGTKLLTATYLPNMRPAKAWLDIPTAASWGNSDYQGVEGLFDGIDETYASWMRDIRLAKGRVMLSGQYLTSAGPGQGAWFDEDREVYAALNIPPTSDAGITINQFAIRHAEHKATIEQLKAEAIEMAGYSTATFGEPDGAALTATEVRARQARTLTTRGRKILYTTPALADIIEALLGVEAGSQFGGTGITVERPTIGWQDSISESPQDLAQTASLLRTAEAASTETLVRLVHPDWDDDQVGEEVGKILAESGRTPLADPAAIGPGGAGLDLGDGPSAGA